MLLSAFICGLSFSEHSRPNSIGVLLTTSLNRRDRRSCFRPWSDPCFYLCSCAFQKYLPHTNDPSHRWHAVPIEQEQQVVPRRSQPPTRRRGHPHTLRRAVCASLV